VTDTDGMAKLWRPALMPVKYRLVSMGTDNANEITVTDLDGDSAHGLVVGGHIEKDSRDHFVAFLFRRKGSVLSDFVR
jgi:hypothetical protein